MKTYSTGVRLIAIILTTAFLTGEVGSGCMGAVKVYAAESEVLSAEEMTGMIPVPGDEVISEDIILSEDETGYDGSGEREGIVLTDEDVFSSVWTGGSGNWTDGQFDGRSGSTEGLPVVFADVATIDEVTVTVSGDKSVTAMGFEADDTAYTLTTNDAQSAAKNSFFMA